MNPIHKHTRLSELKARRIRESAAATDRPVVPTRMLISIEQSMRVEGHTLMRDALIEETLRALSEMRR